MQRFYFRGIVRVEPELLFPGIFITIELDEPPTSKVVYCVKLPDAIRQALDKEDYNLAAQLRDQYKKEFKEDLPDMEQVAKIIDNAKKRFL